MGSLRRALALLLVSLASSLAGVRGAFEIRAAAPCEMAGCCDARDAAACCAADETSPRIASGCGCCGNDGGPLFLLVNGLDCSPVECEPLNRAHASQLLCKRSEPQPASRVPAPEAPPPRA
jgi:hypothetical protein